MFFPLETCQSQNSDIMYNFWTIQVEPNAHKIEEHRRKYDRLRKERDEKKADRERQRRKAEAQVRSFHSSFAKCYKDCQLYAFVWLVY